MATASSAADTVIYACVNKKTRYARIVNATTKCRVTETKISWGGQGEQGPMGLQGMTGAQGPQGLRGQTGPQGPKGQTGNTGPQGPQGLKGETGPQGPKGDTGNTGPAGPAGPKGDDGKQGDKGATGSQGPKGDKGDPGVGGSISPAVKTSPEVAFTEHNNSAILNCDNGKKLVSGGYEITSGASNVKVALADRPANSSGTPTGWYVKLWIDDGMVKVKLYVVCV